MTLTRFLTAYVYNPLALALTRARAAQGLPMLRGRGSNPRAFLQVLAWPTSPPCCSPGVWHGAGYTFILWGLLHGLYLVINHAWRQYGPRPADRARRRACRRSRASLLTFFAVVAAMVLFRAPDIAAAANVLGGMLGLNGVGLPGGSRGCSACRVGPMMLLDGAVSCATSPPSAAYMLALLAIALLMPNSLQMLAAYEPALPDPEAAPPVLRRRRPALSGGPPSPGWCFIAAIAAVSMIWLTGKSEFLYWQF